MSTETLIETFVQLQDKLHLTACRLLRDDADAQDAVQDAFANLWSARPPDSSSEARFRLFAVLKNVCLNKLRRRPIISSDPPERAVEQRYPDSEIERVRNLLLSSLSPLQREVFALATYEELEYDEIARRLDMSQEAVRANMSRARKKLKEQYNRL